MTAGRRAETRSRDLGATLLELLLVSTLLVTVAATAAPLTAQAADHARARAAARYLASRLRSARAQAVAGNRSVALVFTQTSGRWTFRACEDHNGNGIRRADIDAGSDPCPLPAQAIGDLFPGIVLGLAPGTPDLDGNASTAPVRFGTSDMASCTAIGHCTPGSLYIQSDRGLQLAVRVSGVTGRTRAFQFDAGTRRWGPA